MNNFIIKMFNDLNWKCCARLVSLFPPHRALKTGHVGSFAGVWWLKTTFNHVILNEKSVSELGEDIGVISIDLFVLFVFVCLD